MARKTVNIDPLINSDLFLKFAGHFADKFKKQNGFGKWLEEYKRMDKQGLFEPEKLRQQYIQVINNNYRLGFVHKQAIVYICVQALDAVKFGIETKNYSIYVISGEIAIDDNGLELKNLKHDDAITICKSMNEEAEEELFYVK
jgi:hypothetical protein